MLTRGGSHGHRESRTSSPRSHAFLYVSLAFTKPRSQSSPMVTQPDRGQCGSLTASPQRPLDGLAGVGSEPGGQAGPLPPQPCPGPRLQLCLWVRPVVIGKATLKRGLWGGF